MLAHDKIVVVYGGAGHVGSAVARAFAREGARVFLTGRTLAGVQQVAESIVAAGGRAVAAQVDALDGAQIERHLDAVLRSAGHIDVSFNAVWIRGDLQGTPLLQMPVDDFVQPVLTGARTHFLTATAAARHMVKARSGVVLTLSASTVGLSGRDRVYHRTGGFGAACAAIEDLSRALAGELGPSGVRVVCLRSNAIPEAWASFAPELRAYMEQGCALGRLPTLREVADAAVMMASDRASAMTGTIANLTCGSIMDPH
jgi:3-oxoacyl-[acyl-carrier protein] reductase